MKPTTILLPAILFAIVAGSALSQDPERPSRERGERPAHPPLPPIVAALDADQDGEISAAEIENAAAALKTLDQNGDGKLTRDEVGPPRHGPGHGPRHPRGDRPGPPSGPQDFSPKSGEGRRPRD